MGVSELEQQLQRLKMALGVKTDVDLGRKLGLRSTAAVSEAKRRNRVVPGHTVREVEVEGEAPARRPRGIRVSDELYGEVRKEASKTGQRIYEVVEEALRIYMCRRRER